MFVGRKLKPYVVFKRVRQIPELNKVSGMIVALSRNGWMNENLTKDWVKHCWGTLNFGKRLLIWDAYKCHMTDSVKNAVKNVTNSDMSIIPGGLTGYIQPADLCWNKPFKAAYKELYGEWIAGGEKTYTHGENVRAPSKLQCLEWVKKAWDTVEVEVVRKSFRYCGISIAIDGSEDKEIYCIKDGGVASEACAEISRTTATLMAVQDDAVEDTGDPDPFKDIEEDEDELEENEVIIEDDDDIEDDAENQEEA